MKVRISVEVDIDPEAWTLNYGVSGAKEIREDVKRYGESTIVEQLNQVGVLMEVQSV